MSSRSSQNANNNESSSQIKTGKANKKKICISGCRYDVVCRVALEFGFKIVAEHDLWNLSWSDCPLAPEKIMEMRRNQNLSGPNCPAIQKMNHFPGMYEICRKDRLGRNLNRLKRIFPGQYDFFPTTWDLPSDMSDLMEYWRRNRNATFIVKPDSGCQGKGIFLVRNLKLLCPFAKCVCQLYVSQPYLLDGYKYDQRIYVLITCVDPLRIYVYDEGLARFATVKYEMPSDDNLDIVFMHLTNYSLNKLSESYDPQKEGSKRKLSAIYSWMKEQGIDVKKMKDSIDDIIIKTIVCVAPTLRHNYRASFPKRERGCACFELLGFDILVDRHLKPMLVEVNHSPSFNLDMLVDDAVKTQLVRDLFAMIHLGDKLDEPSVSRKRRPHKFNIQRRPGTPFATNISDALKDQFVHEERHPGNFRLVFTEETPGKYAQFLDKEYCIPTMEEEQCFVKKRPELVISNRYVDTSWPSVNTETRTSLRCTRNGQVYVETKPVTPGVMDHDSFMKFKYTAERASNCSNYSNGPFSASPVHQRKIATALRKSIFDRPTRQMQNDSMSTVSDTIREFTALDKAMNQKESYIVPPILSPSQRVQVALEKLRRKNVEKFKFVTRKNDGILRIDTASSTLTEKSFRPPSSTSPYLHDALRLAAKAKKNEAKEKELNNNFSQLQAIRVPDSKILELDASKLPSVFQHCVMTQTFKIEENGDDQANSNESDLVKGWITKGSLRPATKQKPATFQPKLFLQEMFQDGSLNTFSKIERDMSMNLGHLKEDYTERTAKFLMPNKANSTFNPITIDFKEESKRKKSLTARKKAVKVMGINEMVRQVIEIAAVPNRKDL